MYPLIATTTPVVASSSRWVGGVLRGSIDINPSSRTSDEYLPWETDGAYGGICGTYFFQDIPHRRNVPTVFVHGNTADASIWLPMMESFLERGDTGEDLWAITFRESSPSHEAMADQLDDFVARVREYTGYDTVDVVSHSLGVTGVRYWLAREGRYDWVDTFVGLAGANHGSSRCRRLAEAGFGAARPNWFLNPDQLENPNHPLSILNRHETPGDVDYYTLRATRDRFFKENPESPALAGATNEVVETDHRGILTDEAATEYLWDWLRAAR